MGREDIVGVVVVKRQAGEKRKEKNGGEKRSTRSRVSYLAETRRVDHKIERVSRCHSNLFDHPCQLRLGRIFLPKKIDDSLHPATQTAPLPRPKE